MNRGVNKAILVGNVGDDPQTKFTPAGTAITECSIATSKSWKDKQTGEDKSKTEWHSLVFFNRLAEIAGEYVKKGSKIYVEGELETQRWEDNGEKKQKTRIVVNELQMLDSKPNPNMPF